MVKSGLKAVTRVPDSILDYKKENSRMMYGFCLRTYIEPDIGCVGQWRKLVFDIDRTNIPHYWDYGTEILEVELTSFRLQNCHLGCELRLEPRYLKFQHHVFPYASLPVKIIASTGCD